MSLQAVRSALAVSVLVVPFEVVQVVAFVSVQVIMIPFVVSRRG